MQQVPRGVLAAAIGVGLFALATGWVAFDGFRSSSTPAHIEAVTGVPSRINPLTTAANDAEADLAALVFSGLTRIAGDGRPALDLAEAWEVTPDGLTYTFHLRDEVAWHDGETFTAHDVAFTVERIQSEAFDGPAELQAEWANVDVFVADAQTILLRLPEPAADFLVRTSLGILPGHLAEQMDAASGFEIAPFDRRPVGTGPFALAALNEERAVLARHDLYHLGRPVLDRIELRFAEDRAEQRAWLADGSVKAALLGDQQADVAVLHGRPELTLTLLPRNAYTLLYINTQRTPLTDAALRRALTASIDPAAAVTTASAGVLDAGDGVIVPRSWAYERGAGGGAAGPEALAEAWEGSGWVLDEAGVRSRDGEPLRLELVTNNDPQRVVLATAIAEQLTAHGVEVDVVPAPSSRVIGEHLQPGDFSLVLFGWEAGIDPDPYGGWHTSQLGAGNVTAYRDLDSDLLLEAARMILDEAERREYYAQFSERLAQQAPALVIGYPKRIYVHPARLEGIDNGLLFEPASRFRNVHLWDDR